MAKKKAKNSDYNYYKKQREAEAQTKAKEEKKRSLMLTNTLLGTGSCCIIVASMLIMFSKTKDMKFGMPGGLFLCSIGVLSIGLSYSDVARRFALICYAASAVTFICSVAIFLGTLGLF